MCVRARVCVFLNEELKLRRLFKVNYKEFLWIMKAFPIYVTLVADLAPNASTQVIANRKKPIEVPFPSLFSKLNATLCMWVPVLM